MTEAPSWRTGRLGDVLADARPGFACGQKAPDGVIQFRMNNVTREGTLDWSRVRRVPRTVKKLQELLVLPGDLLFNSTSSPDLVGKCAVFDGFSEPVTFSNHFLRIRVDETRADPRYLRRWINLQWSRGVFEGMCRQWVNQATVTKDQILALPLPLPPVWEQRRIADILDRAEALRAKRRAALATLGHLPQALLRELVNDEPWPRRPLGELVEEFRYGTSVKSATDGRPTLRIPNVVSGEVDVTDLKLVPVTVEEFRRLRLQLGDILFVRTNGNPEFVGRCAAFDPAVIVPSGHNADGFVFASYLIRARPKTAILEPVYLREIMLSPGARRELRARCATSAGQFNINIAGLASVPVPLAPRALQEEFSRRVEVVQRLKRAQQAALAKLDVLFASLQRRAFSGEL